MGIVIAFPADRCSVGSGLIEARDDGSSVIILPVIRVERHGDNSDGLEPNSNSSSPRGKRRKR
jgi:hypothetical protein